MNPKCEHNKEAKKVQVKKEGKNQGRWFYTCAEKQGEQCSYFEWCDSIKPQAPKLPQVQRNIDNDRLDSIEAKLDKIMARFDKLAVFLANELRYDDQE